MAKSSTLDDLESRQDDKSNWAPESMRASKPGVLELQRMPNSARLTASNVDRGVESIHTREWRSFNCTKTPFDHPASHKPAAKGLTTRARLSSGNQAGRYSRRTPLVPSTGTTRLMTSQGCKGSTAGDLDLMASSAPAGMQPLYDVCVAKASESGIRQRKKRVVEPPSPTTIYVGFNIVYARILNCSLDAATAAPHA